MAEEQAKQTPEPVKEEPKEEKQEAAPQPPQKKAEPQKKQPEAVSKPTNCMKCNKRLQRKVWYYRNGGYYCSKRCWKAAVEAAAKKQEKTK